MFNQEIMTLALAAATIGLVHTILGPDHYLPFIMMGRAQKWSRAKTLMVTFWCGIGHVSSSVALGLVGVALGFAVTRLEGVEAVRGEIAAWALIGFGLAYAIWGLRTAFKNKPHTHWHTHEGGVLHEHEHRHQSEHAHAHVHAGGVKSITPWALFTIFVLGPCEPLIPMLMYPAAQESMIGMVVITLIFAVVTLVTMLTIVAAASYGIRFVSLGRLERYTHAIAGFTICAAGLSIQLLGL